MGLIKTVRTLTIPVVGSPDYHLANLPAMLNRIGFSRVAATDSAWQLTADYRKMRLWGDLFVQISTGPTPEQSVLYLRATANADNIFAIGENPADKLLRMISEALLGGGFPTR